MKKPQFIEKYYFLQDLFECQRSIQNASFDIYEAKLGYETFLEHLDFSRYFWLEWMTNNDTEDVKRKVFGIELKYLSRVYTAYTLHGTVL